MTMALNIESGEEIAPSGRAGWNAAPGQAAAILLGKEQIAGWPNGARGNSTAAFSGNMSFQSNWQAMLRASGAGLAGNGGTAGATDEIRTAGEDEEAYGTTEDQAKSSLADAGVPEQSMMRRGQSGLQAIATNTQMQIRLQSAVAGWSVPAASQDEIVKEGESGQATVQRSEAAADAHLGRSEKKDSREYNSLDPDTAWQAAMPGSALVETASLLAAGQVAQEMATQGSALRLESRTGVPDAPSNGDNLPFRSSPGQSVETIALNGPATGIGRQTHGTIEPAIPASPYARARGEARTMVTATESESIDLAANKAFIAKSSEAGKGSRNQQATMPNEAGTANQGSRRNFDSSDYRAASAGAVVEGAGMTTAGNATRRGTAASFPISAQPSNAAADATLESGKQALDSTSTLFAHAAGPGETSAVAAHATASQQVGVITDGSASVRVPAGAQGALVAMPGDGHALAGSATSAMDGAPARATFAALDAGTGVGTPNWVHAGARQAEAGFADPALGWVGVRADLNGGSIHASLVPGTNDAAEVLRSHMNGLSAYLTEQHTTVSTLSLEDSSGSGVGTGPGQHMQQGAGQDAGDGRSPQPSSQTDAQAAANPLAQRSAQRGGGFDAIVQAGSSSDGHISVMA